MTQTQTDGDTWVSMSEAAQELGVSVSKLVTMSKRGTIEVRNNPRDLRMRLVNITYLRQLFNTPAKVGER